MSAVNPLFYDTYGRKGEVLFFYSLKDTPRDPRQELNYTSTRIISERSDRIVIGSNLFRDECNTINQLLEDSTIGQ
jgi:hypothetical protein